MKYSILPGLVFLFSALLTLSAHSETLVEYDIGALSEWDGNGLNAPSWGVASNVDASPITVTGSSGYGNYNQRRWGDVKSNLWVEHWPPESEMGAVYYEWTVSAEPGYALNLDDIAVGVGNENGEDPTVVTWIGLRNKGPRNFRLYSSIEGFGNDDHIASVKTASTSDPSKITQEVLSADLGDDYKNVSSVTFRVYGFFDEARYNEINDTLTSESIAGAGLSKFATGVLFEGASGSVRPEGPTGNVSINGSVEDANQSGSIETGRNIGSVDLSTSATSAEEAVEVLEFTLVNQDKGGSATLDVSRITASVFSTFASSFDPGKVTWRLNGPDSDGVIGTYDPDATAITFDVPDIRIDNGTEQTYTIDAHFNDSTGLGEGDEISVKIEGREGVHVSDSGTSMLSGETIGNTVQVAVDATQFVFTAQPHAVVSGEILNPAPEVQARDNFGNVDSDFDDWNSPGNALGTGEGEGEVYSAYAFTTEEGAGYPGMFYDASQDNETFTLRISATVDGRSVTGESDPITADVVATRLHITQQPFAAEPVSGVDAAFTTVPVVQATDSRRVVDTDYSDDITLSVQGSGATTLSARDDADSDADTVTISLINGVAEFTDLMLNYETASTTDIRLLASTSDLDTVQSDAITVLEFNDPPGIDNIENSSVTFFVGDEAVLLDDTGDSELSDPDNADFDGGKLTVAITDGGEPLEDLLTFRVDGDVALAGELDGAEVSVDALVIGTLGHDIAEGQDLVVNFNGDATPERVRVLLQSVLYDNTASAPTTGERTLAIRLDDGRDDVVVAMTVDVRQRPVAPPVSPVITGESRNGALFGNATITEAGVFNGGTIVGAVENRGEVTGTVTLGGSASINGGLVSGQVSGDAGSAARIDGAQVVSGARLENVVIGPETVLEPGVELGANVRFESERSLPAGQELSASMGSIPWVNGDQRSVVNLRGEVVSGQNQNVLASIQQLDGFDTEGIQLEQDETTGELWLHGGDFSASVVPVSVTKAGPDMEPGTSVDEDGNVRFVTRTGRVVTAVPALEDKEGFGDSLVRAGLVLTAYDERGNMVIENADAAALVTGSGTGTQRAVLALTDGGETYHAGRPDLLSVPATRGESPGVVEYVVPGMGGLIAYSVLFEDDDGKLMQQDIVPVPADWVALRTAIKALPGADNVRINERGVISVALGGQQIRALMSYTVVRGDTKRNDTLLIEQGDLTGNGAVDFEVQYPDGRGQHLYLFP